MVPTMLIKSAVLISQGSTYFQVTTKILHNQIVHSLQKLLFGYKAPNEKAQNLIKFYFLRTSQFHTPPIIFHSIQVCSLYQLLKLFPEFQRHFNVMECLF